MIYCISNNIGKRLPGIEHSQVGRVKLLSQIGEPAKIVTLCHSCELYENTKWLGVSNQIFSMYDYFQEAIGDNLYAQKKYYEMWINHPKYRVEHVPNTLDVKVFYEEDYVYYARFFDKEYQKIDYLNHFDGPYQTRRKVRREIFDTRGFLTKAIILGETQKVLQETYYSPSGEEKIVCYYNPERKLSRIELKNYKGDTYFFKTKDEWQAFFFDELNQPSTLFLSDRTQNVMDSIGLMKTKASLVPVIHNVHLRQPYDPVTAEITSPYQKIFTNLENVTAIIASTKHQAQELNERLPENVKAHPIPVGYTGSVAPAPFEGRNPFKIVCMARYYTEKQLLHQIRAIQKLLPQFPKLELHLFGYGDATNNYQEEKMLKKYVIDHHLEEHVFFRGYLKDLDSEYNEAGLMLLTSSIEGFCLSMLEAIEHGLPVLSYDIRYGPSEMIIDGENGYLIKPNDEAKLQEKLAYLLEHPELQQEMSKASYRHAETFNQAAILEKWQAFLQENRLK
ncbi:glycosyltransferase [Vagococcus silagei]|uniref:Glycosyltransferase n=1 Tax=Vagococcus silagei TaxID=2508885 RepID=A0A4S3B432_9ENTE|nr:glycosyltransferase [Vagococcus silagei]THB61894.1 glycosyltransferase [Vagococcus silagei]